MGSGNTHFQYWLGHCVEEKARPICIQRTWILVQVMLGERYLKMAANRNMKSTAGSP